MVTQQAVDAPVPFLDLTGAYRELKDELDDAVGRVLASGRYILGPEVRAFENEFAQFCGVRHCVGTSNGLDALRLVLRAWGVGAGDEVLVPSNTFIATWLAVSDTGATPVPVEPDPRTYNMDPARVESALTARTRAIVPVHLYGQTADIQPVMDIARRRGLKVLEDAAQAQGACYHGRSAGQLGDAAATSFYPGKNLGAMGDAGAVLTDDGDLAGHVAMLANYGSDRKYYNPVRGTNCRLDEMQAAILRVKLRRLEAWNERRRAIARRYLAELAETDYVLPFVPEWAIPVWHLFVVRSTRRDYVRQRLMDRGVETLIHYPVPPAEQQAYADLRVDPDRYPIASTLAREVFSLPMGPHLTPDEVSRVVAALRDIAPPD
jgi:dTDP-4-amino-4,6-dideoxygalactose transaminase